MFTRIVFAAILAGLVSGVSLTLWQSVFVTPNILEAETYEVTATPALPLAQNEKSAWAPADGFERAFYTGLSNVLMSIGFALLLGAAFSLRQPRSLNQGLIWGMAGFAIFFLAPTLGLPPELPGTDAAALEHRQLWWLFTAGSTALGLGLLVLSKKNVAKLSGLVLLVLPHVIGAPHVDAINTTAPQMLSNQFITATALSNLIFWLLLGGVTTVLFKYLGKSS